MQFPNVEEMEAMEAELRRNYLASLPPEKRLEGLSPEERLEGLSPDELRRLRKLLDKQDGNGSRAD